MPTAQHAIGAKSMPCLVRFCVAMGASAFGGVAALPSDALAKVVGLDRHNAGIAGGLYRDINPRAEGDRSSVESFWEDALGGKWEALIEDADFATGFCEGALEIWNKASY